MTDSPPPPSRPIRFRGRSFLALMLAPEQPVAGWLASLDTLIERSPGFFAGRAIVLDLETFATDKTELAKLLADLAARHIRIMAIEGKAAVDLGPGLPPSIGGGRETSGTDVAGADVPGTDPSGAKDASAPAKREAPSAQPTLILQDPVRSGQTISHPHGDVVVLGSVASASEIQAGGSIHVYGALRGRAIAGTTGDANARIFCRKLEAELLAIDGYYMTADAWGAHLRGRAVQVRLENGKLVAAALD